MYPCCTAVTCGRSAATPASGGRRPPVGCRGDAPAEASRPTLKRATASFLFGGGAACWPEFVRRSVRPASTTQLRRRFTSGIDRGGNAGPTLARHVCESGSLAWVSCPTRMQHVRRAAFWFPDREWSGSPKPRRERERSFRRLRFIAGNPASAGTAADPVAKPSACLAVDAPSYDPGGCEVNVRAESWHLRGAVKPPPESGGGWQKCVNEGGAGAATLRRETPTGGERSLGAARASARCG